MSDNNAQWINGSKILKGSWSYNWTGDYFFISLDSQDPITGQPREFRVYDEHPEWGK